MSKLYKELENMLNIIIGGNSLPKLSGADDLLKEIVYAGKEKFNVPVPI